MKVTQLVCDVQTMSMLDYELSNTSNIEIWRQTEITIGETK